jgi:membrane-bound lytic murein transglycosylase MltF
MLTERYCYSKILQIINFMLQLLSRIFVSFFLLISCSLFSKAQFKGDTSILLANNKIEITSISFTRTIKKEANIIYPKSLLAHVNESKEYVQKFSEKQRNYLLRTHQMGKNYFPKVAAVFNRFHLPQELKVLIALESGFNSNAVSSAGAVGYWQFMDAAAKEYGLKIIDPKDTSAVRLKKKDDRKNFTKSTYAAAKYLHDRCKNLNNDILLMVASYNCGIGNVWQAMKKSGKSNPDFWDIRKYLPLETRLYVMNFISLNVVFNNYEAFVNNKMIFATEFSYVPLFENVSKLNASSTD